MSRVNVRLACGAALLVSGAIVGAQQAPSPGPAPSGQVFRGGTEAILVDVYPHRDGRIVEGLTPADFEVLEDGRPQRIDAFEFVRLEGGASPELRADPNTLPAMRALAADPHNRVLVVFLDNGHTTLEGGRAIRQPLVNMLERATGPRDLFGVLTSHMRAQDLTLARLTDSIDEQLSRFWTWGMRQRVTTDAADPMEALLRSCFHVRQKAESIDFEDWLVKDGPVVRYLDDILIERRREARTLEALDRLVMHLGGLREARSVILAVTDGWVLLPRNEALTAEPMRDRRFDPQPPLVGSPDRHWSREFGQCAQELTRLAQHDGARQLREVIAQASRNNVTVYPIASAGLTATDTGPLEVIRSASGDGDRTPVGIRDLAQQSERVTTLRTLAEGTDGFAVVSSNDLGAGLRRVASDMSAYYLLTYASTNPGRDGRYRRIEVRVKTAGIDVRARRGYVAWREGEGPGMSAGLPNSATAAVQPGVIDALDSLSRDRPEAAIFVHGAPIGEQLRIAVELGKSGRTSVPANPAVEAAVGGPGGTLGTANATLDSAWRHAVITLPLPSSPGPWTVTVTVGGGADRLQEQAVIAPAAGPLLGDPLWSRARPAPRAPLRATARPVFSRTERAHVEWPTLAPLERRDARLLDSRGRPLGVPVVVTAVTGPLAVTAADVTLGALANGDYVIELTAEGRGTSTVRYAAFRVTQ
jgi:VWFA-related protein